MSRYLHVGWNRMVPVDDILGLFDYQRWRQSESNQRLIDQAAQQRALLSIDVPTQSKEDSYRTIIFCASRIVLSPIAPATLAHRLSRGRNSIPLD